MNNTMMAEVDIKELKNKTFTKIELNDNYAIFPEHVQRLEKLINIYNFKIVNVGTTSNTLKYMCIIKNNIYKSYSADIHTWATNNLEDILNQIEKDFKEGYYE